MANRRNRFDISYGAPRKPSAARDVSNKPSQREHHHVSIDHSGFSRSSLAVPTTSQNLDISVPTPTSSIISQVPPLDDPDPAVVEDTACGDDFDRRLEAQGLFQLVTSAAQSVSEKQKRKRTQADHPLLVWIPFIDQYVEEFLRLEGLGEGNPICSACSSDIGNPSLAHRCTDCTSAQLFCTACTVSSHNAAPLHRIERWNGSFFERVSLKSMGLKIQLGHPPGEECRAPSTAFDDDFVILDLSGVHEVSLQYCGCQRATLPITQLLRRRLFPSTTTNPQTAATFQLLSFMQMLGFMSGVSVYQVYKSLARITDNTGTKPTRDRYHTLLRMLREWRHVRLLKRMGRGHAADGVRGTVRGELAVPCLACPRPGINLPANYLNQRPSEQFLYALFVGIDANFRLKRMNVSNYQRDPSLNHGFAYIVEEAHYKQYLKEFDTRIAEEKSTCNDHDAIKSANVRGALGTDATGVGTVECSRHDMKRPTSVGDLQKGERYVNIDYLFLRSLEHNRPPRVVVSYDIACQWARKLISRCEEYPTNVISSSSDILLQFLVPKFHLPAHIEECQATYSFNFIPGMGRTDGEAPERGWADADEIVTNTREMGPGSRHDTLDDHFGDYNWRKTAALGETYLRKTNEAIKAREEHIGAFFEFTCALPASCIKEWTSIVQIWEMDSSKPNPYRVPKSYISDKEVRLRLAKEEEDALRDGTMAFVHGEVTPAVLIFQGLELEEQQRRVAIEVSRLGPHATELQRTKVLERANTLRRKIQDWCDIQHLYVPGLATIRACAKSDSPPAAQDLKLYLPSAAADIGVHCDLRLSRVEWLLRYAQAEGTLHELRGHILLRSRLNSSKKRYSKGHKHQTRSQGVISDVASKVKNSAAKYRHVRRCLELLSPTVLQFEWEKILKPLNDEDISGLTYMDDGGVGGKDRQLGEGHKRLSWIWLVQGTGNKVDESTQAALRLEWCKARARAHRWQEECLFLDEEMRRIKASLLWEAERWEKRIVNVGMIQAAHGPPPIDDHPTLAGKIAYAHRQAAIRHSMHTHVCEVWKGLSEKLLNMEDGNAHTMVEAPDEVLSLANLASEDGTSLDTYIEEQRS